MSIVVTGGAGFIGSCIVRTLNDMGIDDIYIVDNIMSTEKWMNMRNKNYIEYIQRSEFLEKLNSIEDITHIIHMGACSATTEKDFDYLWKNNVEYTKTLWNYCADKEISFIYASSAATYGDGEQGFDDEDDIHRLLPLNGYGYSKQIFDIWSLKQEKAPKQHVGLKFFNVFGPNEYFKGSMASMVYHGFNQIKQNGEIKLFKSHNPNYEDGGQLRDFIYIKDICNAISWFMKNESVSGIYNMGTGITHSFKELAEATFKALDLEPNIKYIDMPEHLREKYQYYTKATSNKLATVGLTLKTTSLEDAVADYVKEYLVNDFGIY